jgi:spore coat protein A
MIISRRELLLSAGALALSRPNGALFDLRTLEKFIDPLPLPALATPSLKNGVAEYRLEMREFQKKFHRDLPPATFWGFAGSCPGPMIESRAGKPVAVEWVNNLPTRHLFPIDHTLHGAEADKPAVRTVTHLHGARVPADCDGYPENWFVPGQSARYLYPNEQDATALFYHDHSMGITRLNSVAGLMGLYILRDEMEDALRLPSARYEIPLVLFDRSFRADGQIFYPVSTNPASPWVSEYYGGGILANGALFPYLEVEARTYRFRVLNSSNGSFYRLTIGRDAAPGSKSESFFVIGGDQGMLPSAASVESLLIGPGERSDLLIDFAASPAARVYLRSDTGAILQFRVASDKVTDNFKIPATLRKLDSLAITPATPNRNLTLGDSQDRVGHSKMMLLNGCHWSMPVTEKPVLNTVETWSFINLTDDSHPIHLHLVRFQILERRKFDLNAYLLTKQVVFTDPPTPPAAAESGWKDTVRVDPLSVTRIAAHFGPYTGRYVWHCHMLEHEDNEMMRPYEIVTDYHRS